MPTIWTEHDELHLADELRKLCVVFNRRLNLELLSVYREALDELDGDQAITGLHQCLTSEDRFPPPSKVIKHSGAGNQAVQSQRVEGRNDRRKVLIKQGIRFHGDGQGSLGTIENGRMEAIQGLPQTGFIGGQ